MNQIFKINGIANNYDWGGYHYIPEFLGLQNNEKKPHAEYWLGAHRSAPSILQDKKIPLNKYIDSNPEQNLGTSVYKRFGSLPFLFKILDVRDMLSIQVHPSKKGAEIGFEEENKKGIPQSAPNRNYKDDNHKPELMYALSEFWLLHGFLSEEDAATRLSKRPIYSPILDVLKKEGMKGAFKWTIETPLDQTEKIINPLLKMIEKEKISDKANPEYWIARWTENPNATKIGLLVLLLMNVVKIEKGGAIFQGAGIIHAYLEGQNIELMANSDNVLRGGLTEKHMDFQELFKHTKFETTLPSESMIPATNVSEYENKFDAPIEDFLLSEIKIPIGESAKIKSQQLELYLILEGQGEASSIQTDTHFEIQKGESFASNPNCKLTISATTKPIRIFRAKANL